MPCDVSPCDRVGMAKADSCVGMAVADGITSTGNLILMPNQCHLRAADLAHSNRRATAIHSPALRNLYPRRNQTAIAAAHAPCDPPFRHSPPLASLPPNISYHTSPPLSPPPPVTLAHFWHILQEFALGWAADSGHRRRRCDMVVNHGWQCDLAFATLFVIAYSMWEHRALRRLRRALHGRSLPCSSFWALRPRRPLTSAHARAWRRHHSLYAAWPHADPGTPLVSAETMVERYSPYGKRVGYLTAAARCAFSPYSHAMFAAVCALSWLLTQLIDFALFVIGRVLSSHRLYGTYFMLMRFAARMTRLRPDDPLGGFPTFLTTRFSGLPVIGFRDRSLWDVMHCHIPRQFSRLPSRVQSAVVAEAARRFCDTVHGSSRLKYLHRLRSFLARVRGRWSEILRICQTCFVDVSFNATLAAAHCAICLARFVSRLHLRCYTCIRSMSRICFHLKMWEQHLAGRITAYNLPLYRACFCARLLSRPLLPYRLIASVASSLSSAVIAHNTLCCILIILFVARRSACAPDDASQSFMSRPPVFAGTRDAWTAWVIAFSAWLAWKLTDAAAIFSGDEPEPTDAGSLTHASTVATAAAATSTAAASTAYTPPHRRAASAAAPTAAPSTAAPSAAPPVSRSSASAAPATAPPPSPSSASHLLAALRVSAELDAASASHADPAASAAARSLKLAQLKADWLARNAKLYGAIVMAMPEWLKTSLHIKHHADGVGALRFLQLQYDSNDANDRAAAVARLHARYIESRADLSEDDLRLQFDSMMVAEADVVRAGGAAYDDSLMISLFDNSLPQSYGTIRQLVRRSAHTSFAAHFADYMGQVKAELSSRRIVAHAFAAASSSADTANAGTEPNAHALNAQGVLPRPPSRGGGRTGRGTSSPRASRGRGSPSIGTGGTPTLFCPRCLRRHAGGRAQCRSPKVSCKHCGCDHHHLVCPFGEGSSHREGMPREARNLVDREANRAKGSSPPQATAHTATSSVPSPPVAQPASQPPPDNPAAAPPAPDSTAAAQAYSAAIRALGYCSTVSGTQHPVYDSTLPHPQDATVVGAFVDDMATFMVVPHERYLCSITDANPRFGVDTAAGKVPVRTVGTACVALHSSKRGWVWYEVHDVLVVPSSPVLYSTRAMRKAHAISHRVEEGHLLLPPVRLRDAPTRVDVLDTGSSYDLTLAFSPVAHPAMRRSDTPSIAARSASAHGLQASVSGTPQGILYHRLGFPYAQSWSRVTDALTGHGLPPGSVPSSTMVTPEAVMLGRTRALPFNHTRPADSTPPAPGAVIYMDFTATNLLPSYLHRYTVYCGCVDAGSGYARVYPGHRAGKEEATAALAAFVAELAAIMGLSNPIKPQVVNCDNGPAFVSHFFREFVADRQARLRFSAPYTPQQNSYVERMWGYAFGTARVFLAAANLPPTFHPFALQTALWVHNRLPRPSRGNQSPYYILSRQKPDITFLHAFGCLCDVRVPESRRNGDRHFADRGHPCLYLGPSEQSQASVVYVLSTRRIETHAHLLAWEDRFPGIKGERYDWSPPAEPAQPGGPDGSTQPSTTTPATPPSTLSPESPAPVPAPSGHRAPPPPPSPLSAPPSPATSSNCPASAPLASAASPATPLAHHEGLQSVPESSPMIAAASPQLGRRSQRLQHVPRPVYVGQSYRGGAELRHRRPWAAAAFVPPTSANPAAAVFNFCTLAQRDLRFPGFVYLASSVDMSSASSGLDDARALVAMAFASSVSLVATEDMGNVPLPKTYKQALNCEHSEYWIEAINKELTGLLRLRSWDYVPVELLPPGSNIMHCHFIFTVKRIRSGAVEKFKARLVADGNTQKYLVDFDRVFSAVVKPATIRLLLIIAAALDLDLCQVDIKQAYLQSELKEDLYMRVPPGLSPYDADGRPVCCKLRRALYGCKQSGKLWADEFAKFLVDYGFTRSTIDTCLFTLRSSDGFIILCAIYVDDAAIAHNSGKTYQAFLKSLSKRFPVDDRGTLQWLLGVSITRDRGKRSISLSQDLYVADLLKRYAPYIAAGHTRGYDSPMEEGIILNRDDAPEIGSSEWEAMADKRADYMAIVGSLLWLSTMTYPQLAYATSQLGRFVNNPGESHLNAATRVLIYLSGVRSHTIEICPQMDRPLEVYVDSSWQSQFSSSGALFFLYGCLFAWFSKTQRSVSLSSAEAEFFGAMLAAKDAVFYRELLHDLLTAAGLEVQAAPTVIWSDSKSAVDLAFDPVAFKNTKHILRAAYFLRDLVLKRAVILNHLKGTHMLADLLTKAQSRPVFLELMRRLRANDTRPIASPSGRQDDSPPPPSPPPSPSDGTLHTSDAPPAASAQTPRRRRPPPIQRKSAAAIFCANCDQRLHRVQFGYVWDRCTVCRVPLCLDTRLCVETSSYLHRHVSAPTAAMATTCQLRGHTITFHLRRARQSIRLSMAPARFSRHRRRSHHRNRRRLP